MFNVSLRLFFGSYLLFLILTHIYFDSLVELELFSPFSPFVLFSAEQAEIDRLQFSFIAVQKLQLSESSSRVSLCCPRFFLHLVTCVLFLIIVPSLCLVSLFPFPYQHLKPPTLSRRGTRRTLGIRDEKKVDVNVVKVRDRRRK